MKKSFIPKAVRKFLMLDVYNHSSDNDKKLLDTWMLVVKLALTPNKLVSLIVQVLIQTVKKIRK